MDEAHLRTWASSVTVEDTIRDAFIGPGPVSRPPVGRCLASREEFGQPPSSGQWPTEPTWLLSPHLSRQSPSQPPHQHNISVLSESLICLVYQELGMLQGVPKKSSPCLRGHNSPKNGTKNKSRVSFEILRSSAF